VTDVYKNTSFKYFKKFFFNNLPRHNELDMSFVQKLKDLKQNVSDSDKSPGGKNTETFQKLL